MSIYVDTEFSTYRGDLISIALACTDGTEFYAVRQPQHYLASCNDWVKDNILPIIAAGTVAAEPDDVWRERLWEYFKPRENHTCYADWSEDLTHLLMALQWPFETKRKFVWNGRLIHTGDTNPKIPHHALSDAHALMQAHQQDVRGP